jgi:predicted transposase YbfD/YdcC
LPLVSAWSAQNRLVLGQRATEATSNEITAIPQLLRRLDMRGCTVTIDAMGCQKAIAQPIIDQGGNDGLVRKGNQANRHRGVQETFQMVADDGYVGGAHGQIMQVENGHGRLETRQETLITEPS